MDINTFATIIALASVGLTLAGAMLFIRSAPLRPEADAEAQIASLFPLGHC